MINRQLVGELCQEITSRFSAPNAKTGITSRLRIRRKLRIGSSSRSFAESAGVIRRTRRRNSEIVDFRFPISDCRLSDSIGNQSTIQDRGIVLAASTAVSKTVRPGSNPGTPASLFDGCGRGREVGS